MKKVAKKVIKKTAKKKVAAPKKAKQKKIELTKEQVSLILDTFYKGMQTKVLDLVFAPTEKETLLLQEMLDFVSQKIVKDVKLPAKDDQLVIKISEILEQDGLNMAQDLVFSQVASTMEAGLPACDCGGDCEGCQAQPQETNFNTTRGLG